MSRMASARVAGSLVSLPRLITGNGRDDAGGSCPTLLAMDAVFAVKLLCMPGAVFIGTAESADEKQQLIRRDSVQEQATASPQRARVRPGSSPQRGRSLGSFRLASAVVTSCGHFSGVPAPSCVGAHTSLLLGLIRVADADASNSQIMLCSCRCRIHGKWERQPGLGLGRFPVSAAACMC